jgi:hypothetical protein
VAAGSNVVASGHASVALGKWLEAGPATNAIVIGKGQGGGPTSVLTNNIENSLVVAFGDTAAALFVGGTDNNVGVGTRAPQRKLHVGDAMRLEPLSAAPTPAAEGDMYMDAGTHKLMVYDGTTWHACW